MKRKEEEEQGQEEQDNERKQEKKGMVKDYDGTHHTIYPSEHGEHCFMVIVVKKPDAWILVIFLKRYCICYLKHYIGSLAR